MVVRVTSHPAALRNRTHGCCVFGWCGARILGDKFRFLAFVFLQDNPLWWATPCEKLPGATAHCELRNGIEAAPAGDYSMLLLRFLTTHNHYINICNQGKAVFLTSVQCFAHQIKRGLQMDKLE